jgi:hypothetical protein
MRFSYRLEREQTGWIAACQESDAMGEGKTPVEAVEALRKALEERMFRPDAVAPPSQPSERPSAPIELVLARGT